MSMDSIFNPGAGNRDDQLAAEKLLPAPLPVTGAPPLEPVDIGVDIPDMYEVEPFEA